MIDYIIYSEFDNNEGSVVKIEYPHKTGISETILSSYMIPEGAHNIRSDTFCFIVNKVSSKKNDYLFTEIKKVVNQFTKRKTTKYFNFVHSKIYQEKIMNQGFQIKKVYNLNTESKSWESLSTTEEYFKKNMNLFIKICQDEKEKIFKFSIYLFKDSNPNNKKNHNIETIFEIPIHIDIQFQKLKDNFVCVYTLDSKGIGFEFKNNEDASIINSLFEDKKNIKEIYCETEENFCNDLIKNSSSIINNTNKDIYFLCSLQTRVDKSNQRGAVYKSIAVGTTKLINLESFNSLSNYLLKEAFKVHEIKKSSKDKIEIMKKIIEEAFKSFNSLKFQFGVNVSRYERGVFSYLIGSQKFILPTTPSFESIKVSPSEKIDIDLSLTNNEEKVFQGSLIELILIFRENTMVIYDGILNDQRIIFVGGPSTSCSKLSRLIFSTLNMVGPLAFGFIKRLHPYKNLYDLEFLKSKNCIYAVTNPIFKSKVKDWDILCEVETGKIAISSEYQKKNKEINKESDHIFIQEIIYKIENDHISDFEVEQYFNLYTAHLIKIVNNEYFSEDEYLNNEINKQSKRKVNLNESEICKIENEYEALRNSISFNGTTFASIKAHINSLTTRKNIEKEELTIIYNDIENFVSGGDFYCCLFMWLITNMAYDFEIVLNGIFSKHNEIKKVVKNIYDMLCKNKIGMLLMKKVNYFYLMRLNNIK